MEVKIKSFTKNERGEDWDCIGELSGGEEVIVDPFASGAWSYGDRQELIGKFISDEKAHYHKETKCWLLETVNFIPDYSDQYKNRY